MVRRGGGARRFAGPPASGLGSRDRCYARRRATGIRAQAHDPSRRRMREDRLRAVRCIRFAERFGFELDPATCDAIRGSAGDLTRLSAERVKQELDKTMEQVTAPSRALRFWLDSGAAEALLPELVAASEVALSAVDCAAQPGPRRKPGRRLVRLPTVCS